MEPAHKQLDPVPISLFHADIVGVIASFLIVVDLRLSFGRVCKSWSAIARTVLQGMLWFCGAVALTSDFFIEDRARCVDLSAYRFRLAPGPINLHFLFSHWLLLCCWMLQRRRCVGG